VLPIVRPHVVQTLQGPLGQHDSGRATGQFDAAAEGEVKNRPETVLRKTLHHPIVYVLAFIVGWITMNDPAHGGAIIGGVSAAIVVWFWTWLLP
jgi:hypothetical protein